MILIGIVTMVCIEITEISRNGIRYFKSGANFLDCINILCSGICLISTWIDKDTAIGFGATSVLFSWIIFSKAIGDIPIIGNWVYLLGDTVKKIIPFLLVFMPLLLGFGLKFKFMFPAEVCMDFLTCWTAISQRSAKPIGSIHHTDSALTKNPHLT